MLRAFVRRMEAGKRGEERKWWRLKLQEPAMLLANHFLLPQVCICGTDEMESRCSSMFALNARKERAK